MRISFLPGFTAFVRSFSSFLAWVVVVWLSSGQSANGAGLIESFSYNNGGLTSVSAGAWQSWGGGGNATVVNGAARYEDTTDLIRPFSAVLTAPGEMATFSFTINVAAANTSEGYEVAFQPSSAPFGPGNTNYGSGLAFGFDYLDAPAGMSSMQVAEGSGNFSSSNAGNNFVNLGNMTTGVTHTFALTLVRGATYTDYTLFLDSALLYSNSSFPPFFRITDPRAINSVEIDQAGAAGSSAGSALIDNLIVVPEPTAGLMLCIGGLMSLSLRRR